MIPGTTYPVELVGDVTQHDGSAYVCTSLDAIARHAVVLIIGITHAESV
jgi:hypothetical protein